MTIRALSGFIPFILTGTLLLSPAVMASVVMLNTRVIYPADAQSQTLQFTNSDNIPYVMQIWSDINDPESMPDNANAPFMTVPALFRIEPHTGQSVRLVFTGKDLPKDRESIFYLNSVQVPPKNMAPGNRNHMSVILRNRVKIFYRPKSIKGSPDDVPQQIHFSLEEEGGRWVLVANNTSGYYASIISASVVSGTHNIPFKVNMIPPKTTVRWPSAKSGKAIPSAGKVKFTLINDYGGQTQAQADLDK
ncbi:molecular chaperone [Pseudenterobacter timonensis]|uniref:Molecular chaperone n=1 Tax=Pseudenterobacter timonensis TaxID=1755099 RepID=A0AAE4ITT1_9ENTR|nr:molecular chaperone [Pseudenterobacter timonensis]MDR9889179.1 molecular chaperone [Pseudenterobacter timonensis]